MYTDHDFMSVCEIIPKVIQSVTAEHCKSEQASEEGRAVYAIMAEFNDWPTLDNAKPINARLDEVVVLLREHGDSLKELMETNYSKLREKTKWNSYSLYFAYP